MRCEAVTALNPVHTSGLAEGENSGMPRSPVISDLDVAFALPVPELDITLVAHLNESTLVAELTPLFGSQAQVWLLKDGMVASSLAGTGANALPSAIDLAALRMKDGQLGPAASRSGQSFLYALAELQGGQSLLIAEPVADSATTAMAFGRRLTELGLLLTLGVLVGGVGADVTVGHPLKQVATAVGKWRAGGRFDPGPIGRAPSEVTELVISFSEATAALGQREQQLRDATAQQELLMQEIHHRVKNNLQVVASLLNLQASRIRQPAARAEFHAARDRIRALATLHRHLYAHGELHTINMRGFLEELCQQLMQAMGETPGGGRMALTIEAPELQISSDQAVPMALLVTEAVSNAVKYAFPGGRSGHIAVRLELTHDDTGRPRARLTIDDDGVGIPAGRAETDSGVRDGLGLQLIRGFARQLGATLNVTEKAGTHYVVEMALHRERSADEPSVLAEEVVGTRA